MALYFQCEDESNFTEAERVVVEEYGWIDNPRINQYFSQNQGEYLKCMRGQAMVQISVLPMNSNNLQTPLPKDEVPEIFNRLYEILKPVSMQDDLSQPVSLCQLIQE